MADLPHPWPIYARLQTALSSSSRISDEAWGTEAALDHIITTVVVGEQLTADDAGRTAASRRRLERRRRRERGLLMYSSEISGSLEAQIVAREELRIAEAKVSPLIWSLLVDVAIGNDYSELGMAMGVSAGALRVKVLRARSLLSR